MGIATIEMNRTESDLLDTFGFAGFRPGQQEVVEALLAGRSALAVFPTGGGKSLCYQLPALQFDGLTLVVSPLIALMKDQIDYLKSKGVQAERLDSSLTGDQVKGITRAVEAGELKLLYVAPERFTNERFLAMIGRAKIAMMAIDEAHCISEWGHNFRPDYLKLARMATEAKVERVLALTATATPSVVADIRKAFGIAVDDAVVTGFYRSNLTMITTPVQAAERDATLLARLRERPAGPTIVYVTFQRTAESVAENLASAGLPARAYHAGMESDVRAQVQDWWMNGDNKIVVATIAFGMGIDKASVRYVYHYNLPKGLESYSQEIGRAGRDGLPSTVEVLACRDDVPALENFAYGDTPSRESLKGLLSELLAGAKSLLLNQYELSIRHDIRPLVLRTALTYLELLGVLRQGTPIYAGYEFKLLVALPELLSAFPGEPGHLVKNLIDGAKRGRIWYALNPEEVAERLGQPRSRVIRALEVLDSRGLIELKAGDVRTPYTVLDHGLKAAEILDHLTSRFEQSETHEVGRLAEVVDLVELDGCQVNALVAHFGELRLTPCGHCSYCMTGHRQELAPIKARDIEIGWPDAKALYERIPESHRAPRQLARILCGLSSPAISKDKLSRDRLFGSLEAHPFAQVLAWCETRIATTPAPETGDPGASQK